MKDRIYFSVFFLLSFGHLTFSQSGSIYNTYFSSYDTLVSLLKSNDTAGFKKAVFITENAYTGNQMKYEKFDRHIGTLTTIIKAWMRANPVRNYHFSDSINFEENFAIYKFLKDTIHIIDEKQNTYSLLPYTYDFTDFAGSSDWGYMFVTKLLATKSGNCHSLPYLYKILANELGASCWLALAPNHIYIENRCTKIGWYNTELTSGCFPIDAWIMASGYLPIQAVQSGIYMDTLSNEQSIALCVLDLAKGYEHKTHNYTDGFILKCCDLSLQYYPLNVQAMLLKAETLKHKYEKEKAGGLVIAKHTFAEMQSLYLKLFDLGYREMPNEMYEHWLVSIVKERDKYSNKGIKDVMQNNHN